MPGFVDLHCHILPGLDDGAVDVGDSLAMARRAAADGIETICATPHIRADHDVRIEQLPERVEALNAALAQAGIAVTVVTGGELGAERFPMLSGDELRAISLGGGGRWILLEPRPGPMDDALEETIEALHARGFRAVIAHPERHAGADAADRLAAVVRRGALVQATVEFLYEGGAAPVLAQWADAGLVHLVGSDAHTSRAGRPAAVSRGLGALLAVPAVSPHIDWVAREGPRAVVAGEDVTPPF